MFLIYKNDMKDPLQYSSISLFAEDELLYYPVCNSKNVSCYQKDLDYWSMVDKCQVVLFDHRGQGDCNITYTLYGSQINSVESFRCLVVTVSGDFRCHNHMNNFALKAYKC